MPRPGIIVGRKYRLEEPIGQGGMATVWRAVHITLDRPVAVKFLEAVGSHSKQLAKRFLQEAKLAAGIRHRHVVDIVDFGVTDHGQPYMVMELLVGQSLADRYSDGPHITEWAILEIAAMTLGGLAAVHDAGILHRDVKPENIFLVEDGDGTYPKLIDFGVSKGFQQGDRITRTGAVVGTPEYMSPEQARGLKEVGPKTDIWAMGVVLYEALCGETPFESENPGDVLIAVATQDPQPITERRPDLPRELAEVVQIALRKEPAQRYESARAMRRALHAVMQSDAPIEGRPERRSSYGPVPGSGLIRVVSAVPPPPPDETNTEFTVPSLPKFPSYPEIPRHPTPPELEIDTLPTVDKPAHVRAPARAATGASPWLLRLGLSLAALALVGLAFYLLDGVGALERSGLLGGAAEDGAASGELRPGRDVSALSEPIGDGEEIPEIEFDPPPTDGVTGPDAQTIDVPSPPDPPSDAEELSETWSRRRRPRRRTR